jgi:hypothetical protein
MGCAGSTFLPLAIAILANVYGLFVIFAFAPFSQNKPQKPNGVSNGSIKSNLDTPRSCIACLSDFGRIVLAALLHKNQLINANSHPGLDAAQQAGHCNFSAFGSCPPSVGGVKLREFKQLARASCQSPS